MTGHPYPHGATAGLCPRCGTAINTPSPTCPRCHAILYTTPSPGATYPRHSSYPVAPSRSNGLAVASLVLGILWVGGLASVLAIIFGHVANWQIGRSNGEQDGRDLAIAGIVLGWIGIGIGALILMVLYSVLDAR